MGGGSSLHICACVEMCTLIPTHLGPWGGGGRVNFGTHVHINYLNLISPEGLTQIKGPP